MPEEDSKNQLGEDPDKEEIIEEISRIKGKLKDLDNLEDKISSIADKTLMEQLKELSLEDEIKTVEDALGHMSAQELQEKLNTLEQIQEEYKKSKVQKKLQYLYNKQKKLRKKVNSNMKLKKRVDKLQNKITELAEDLSTKGGSSSSSEDLEDLEDKVYSLRDRIKDLKGKMNKFAKQERGKISELEGKIDNLGGSEEGTSEKSQDIKKVKKELNEKIRELRDDISNFSGSDNIENLEEKIDSRLKELLEGSEESEKHISADISKKIADELRKDYNDKIEQIREEFTSDLDVSD